MDKKSFDLLLESGGSSIVIFSAKWCVPCKTLKQIVSELPDSIQEKIIFCDVDKDVELCEELGIMSIPTVLYINKLGFEKRTGVQKKAELCGWFD